MSLLLSRKVNVKSGLFIYPALEVSVWGALLPSFHDHTSPSDPKWGSQGTRQQEAEGKRSLGLSQVGPELGSVGEYFKNTSDKKHSPRNRFCSSFIPRSGNSTSHEFQLAAQIKCRPLGNTSGIRALFFSIESRESQRRAPLTPDK